MLMKAIMHSRDVPCFQLRAAHHVILILPLHLRQIHAAVVGLPALLAVAVLHEQTEFTQENEAKMGDKRTFSSAMSLASTPQHRRKYAIIVIRRKLASLLIASC